MWASPSHSSPLSLSHRRVRLRCRDVLMTFGPVSLNSFVAQTWRGRHTTCNLCSSSSSSCASTLASQSLSLSQLTSPSASFIFINLTYFFLRKAASRRAAEVVRPLRLPPPPCDASACLLLLPVWQTMCRSILDASSLSHSHSRAQFLFLFLFPCPLPLPRAQFPLLFPGGGS